MSKIGAVEPVELGNIRVKASEEKPERGEDKPHKSINSQRLQAIHFNIKPNHGRP